MDIRTLMARPLLRRFAGEFLMIMLGVLAALALGEAAQSLSHARAAKATKVMLDAEIRANLKIIRGIRSRHLERLQSMTFLADLLLKDIKAGVSDADTLAHFSQARAAGKYFGMNINTPLMRHTEWDVAVADQSAGWMEPAELRRYAGVYAVFKMLPEHVRSKMPQVLNGPEMVNVESDLDMGKIDPRVLYRASRQVIAAFEMADANLGSTEAMTAQAFPELEK
jgi:hypothetical protein